MNLMNQYIICKNQQLGKGATGEVYVGRCLKNHDSVAVKIIDLKTIDNQVSEYLLNMEKTALMTVNNPYVLRGIKIIQNNLNCYMITELCNGGTLKAFIKANGPLGEEKSMKIFSQILKGECSLIENGILHRDLKPANILMHNGQTKIIDFGYCQINGFKKPNLHYNVGSPSYMSPEAFLKNQYSEKSEVWALGVTLYECLNGKTFDQGKHMAEVYRDIKKYGIPFKVEVNKTIKSIIRWCLEADPKDRPNFSELLDFVNQKQIQKPVQRTSIQSIRDSFTPIEQIDYKSSNKTESKGHKKKIWVQKCTDQMLTKDDVLKISVIQNKGRSISNYEQVKVICDKKILEKASVFTTRRSKYEKNVFKPLQNKPSSFKKPFYERKFQDGQNYDPISKFSQKNGNNINLIKSKMVSRPLQMFLAKDCPITVTER